VNSEVPIRNTSARLDQDDDADDDDEAKLWVLTAVNAERRSCGGRCHDSVGDDLLL